jgi:ABC-type transporter MlaC component
MQRHAGVLRHNGTAGMSRQAARQGRFGSRFAEHAGHEHGRTANIAAHRAWRHGWRAGFVAWYGPVFWPYAYSDIFDYAFWPYGYDDGFWFYAYDDFFDGVFWGEVGPPEDYGYASAAPAVPRASYAGMQELCTQPGTGITAWPFAAIERKVGLNADQKQLLGDVRKAAADAAATFKASCPAENAFPLTPPGRLQAMTARLQGTLDAAKIVRPPLEKFYAALSDEQKERFNELGPKTSAKTASNAAETTGAAVPDANSCKQPKPGLANLPIERIEDVVKPSDAQQAALKQLQDATDKAVSLLQAACPDQTPLTPPGRLEAMEKRLQAMIDAANTVKPSLDSFYASLSNEQKARFDRLGRALAQTSG